MPTGARVRRRFDVGRLAMAVKRPGIDPRTWAAGARVDAPIDAARWDLGAGWVVDVTIVGGPLDGEQIPIRVSEPLGGNGYGEFLPPVLDTEIAIALPAGDPEENPVMLGCLHNARYALPPVAVAGLAIAGPSLVTPPLVTAGRWVGVTVAPADSEIRKSPWNRIEEYGGVRLVVATSHVLEGDSVLLGSRRASHPVPYGDTLIQDLVAVVDALISVLGTGSNMGGTVVFADLATFATEWNSKIKPELQVAYSAGVKVD